jgi:HAE1 family hydrophobic/amphiphilic exporter-1
MQLAGPDLDTLNQISDEVLATLGTIPGMQDVRNTSNTGTPELHIQLDRRRMAQLNVTSQAVATALRTAISGSLVTEYRPAGQSQQDITMIASDANRADLNNLSAIPVATGQAAGAGAATAGTTASGAAPIVTLGQVATISFGTGPVTIQRVDRNRTMTITGTATGRSLGDVAKDVQTAMKSIQLPAGYSFQLRGGVQQLNNSFAILGQALILSVVLEYMLLVALYESWFYPIVLILGVPLGIVGSLVGLFVTHNTLNIFSVIGLIMAVGLVAKTGILLVDYTNTLRRRGMARTDALKEAARVRLRPILMTTATMTFGMLPLALKLEPGAESRAPMAVVVIGGLLSSTFLAIFPRCTRCSTTCRACCSDRRAPRRCRRGCPSRSRRTCPRRRSPRPPLQVVTPGARLAAPATPTEPTAMATAMAMATALTVTPMAATVVELSPPGSRSSRQARSTRTEPRAGCARPPERG